MYPGHQIYAGIDGYTTCAESSAMRGAGNERVWKISTGSRAIITDNAALNFPSGYFGSAERVDRAWLANKQSTILGFFGDNDWDALFQRAGSYK